MLNSQSPPLSSPSPYSSPVRCDSQRGEDLLAQGEQSEYVHLQYSPAQLLAVTPARLSSGLVSCIRSLQIGVRLLGKRYRRKRNQCKPADIKVLCLNPKSRRLKATDIHELIIGNAADVLKLTESRLCPQSNEAYIAVMTSAGFIYFPVQDREDVGSSLSQGLIFPSLLLSDLLTTHRSKVLK